jgi:hypothetical protein
MSFDEQPRFASPEYRNVPTLRPVSMSERDLAALPPGEGQRQCPGPLELGPATFGKLVVRCNVLRRTKQGHGRISSAVAEVGDGADDRRGEVKEVAETSTSGDRLGGEPCSRAGWSGFTKRHGPRQELESPACPRRLTPRLSQAASRVWATPSPSVVIPIRPPSPLFTQAISSRRPKSN